MDPIFRFLQVNDGVAFKSQILCMPAFCMKTVNRLGVEFLSFFLRETGNNDFLRQYSLNCLIKICQKLRPGNLKHRILLCDGERLGGGMQSLEPKVSNIQHPHVIFRSLQMLTNDHPIVDYYRLQMQVTLYSTNHVYDRVPR